MRFEVVIVDDGSGDRAAAEAADLAVSRPWLRVENHRRATPGTIVFYEP